MFGWLLNTPSRINAVYYRGVFRTMSNLSDGAFLAEIVNV